MLHACRDCTTINYQEQRSDSNVFDPQYSLSGSGLTLALLVLTKSLIINLKYAQLILSTINIYISSIYISSPPNNKKVNNIALLLPVNIMTTVIEIMTAVIEITIK